MLYVAPFYLSRALRTSTRHSRDSPQSIRARCRSVYATCVLSTIITLYVLIKIGSQSSLDVLRLLGIWPISIIDIVRPLLLVVILFIGPLFESGIVESRWRHWGRWSIIRESVYDDWTGWRNLVVGPISEEYVFRAQATALFLLAQSSAIRIMWFGPLIFGVAHVHHFSETIIHLKSDKTSYMSALLTPAILLPAVLRSVFQFGYTTLFGAFAGFVILRTGNLYACVLVHTFCNWMGLPRFWGRVQGPERGGTNSRESHNVDSGDASPRESAEQTVPMLDIQIDASPSMDNAKEDAAPQRATAAYRHANTALGVQWTVAYYTLLLAGAIGFALLLWRLTASPYALAQFERS